MDHSDLAQPLRHAVPANGAGVVGDLPVRDELRRSTILIAGGGKTAPHTSRKLTHAQ